MDSQPEIQRKLLHLGRRAAERDRQDTRVTRWELLARWRTADIRKVLHLRCGDVLPDDDAGREYLKQLLISVVRANISNGPSRAMKEVQSWAPWMSDTESEKMVGAALNDKRRLNPDKMAEELGVTLIERVRLGLKTIRCCDATKQELEQVLRDLKAARRRFRRRQAGIRSNADSAARTKPWLAADPPVSRRTWYRRRAQARPP